MKKILAVTLALAMVLSLGAIAFAADEYTVELVDGQTGSVVETVTVAAGEDLVFTISCSAPADMGPTADGEDGAGVTTTSGTITYSNITTGGPNAYPTYETVTVSGIDADCTVTITINPDEVDGQFPQIMMGEVENAASGEPSGEASGEASGDTSEDAYHEYLHQWLIAEDEVNSNMDENIRENEFMPLIYANDYETFPAEMLWSGMLENGCPMTYEEFVAAGGVYEIP